MYYGTAMYKVPRSTMAQWALLCSSGPANCLCHHESLFRCHACAPLSLQGTRIAGPSTSSTAVKRHAWMPGGCGKWQVGGS